MSMTAEEIRKINDACFEYANIEGTRFLEPGGFKSGQWRAPRDGAIMGQMFSQCTSANFNDVEEEPLDIPNLIREGLVKER